MDFLFGLPVNVVNHKHGMCVLTHVPLRICVCICVHVSLYAQVCMQVWRRVSGTRETLLQTPSIP